MAKLTPQEMRAFAEADGQDPAISKLYDLTVEYATTQGGQTLAVWRLLMGRIFGEPWMMTPDEVAKRLKVPVSEVARIQEQSNAVILSRWFATPEYQESRYRDMHQQDRR